MAEITIPANTSVDLYVALGATIGADQIRVQCKSDNAVYLTRLATAPTNKNDGVRLGFGESRLNTIGDDGAFASAYIADVKIFAEVV